MKRWLIGIGVFLAVLFTAKVLLLDLAASPSEPFVIDVDALHRAATQGGGALPTQIDVEKVANFAFPSSLAIAGSGFSAHKMVLLAHRVDWPDHSIIIDTAMAPKAAAGMPGATADAAAYARLEKALPKADSILFTHEHVDHVGGVASAPSFDAIADKVIMTREQLDGPRLERDKFKPGTLERIKPLEYTGLHVVAPGVVLQKAPGHSTGTQLIYVELADGKRYLFVGDIAWTEDNITEQRGRPALITLIGKEDRAAVASQVQAIAALPKDVHVVVAHDPVAYERDLKAGLFHQGFGD